MMIYGEIRDGVTRGRGLIEKRTKTRYALGFRIFFSAYIPRKFDTPRAPNITSAAVR